MFNILTLIAFCLLGYSIFFIGSTLSKRLLIPELFMMLFPYWIILNLIFLAIIFITLQFKVIKLTFFNVSVFFLLVITLYMSFNYLKFNYFSFPEVQAATDREINIAAFNKLYSNTNYQDIDNKINSINPKFIGLTELKKEDVVKISSLQQYKFSILKDARDDASIALFSKFPIELDNNLNLPHVLALKMLIDNQEYRVFVVHPMPPINTQWLSKRNQELIELTNYINSLNSENIIIIGDFNLTPWSKSYKDFSNNLKDLKNVSEGAGINFTWGNKFIKTQVDHIFIPKKWTVEQFKNEKVSGSDHNLIWVKAKY